MAGISIGSATATILVDAKQALAAIEQVQQSFGGLQKSTGPGAFKQVAGGLGAAIATGFGMAIKSAMSFEQSMDGVGASLGGVDTAAGVTTETFAALREEALRIGADTSKSASEAAQAMDLMAKAGVDAETILNGGAQAAVNLSEATGESLAVSAETTAAAFALFSDQGYSAGQIADFLTTAMNNSSASMSELQTGLSNLAPVIATTGMGLDEAGALIAYFNSQGISAARVGTSLATAFRMVTSPTHEAALKMKEMGIEAFDLQGNFIGFPALFDQVAAATADMSEEQRAAALSLIFGAEAADVMAIAAKNGGDDVRQLTADMNISGSAAASAAQRMDNLAGSWETFTGALSSTAIDLGTRLIPVLRTGVDAAASLVTAFAALPDSVKNITLAVAGLAAVWGTLTTGGALASVIPGFSALGPVIAGLAGPITLVVAALAGLGFAYSKNFLGLKDAVQGVVDTVRQVWDVFRLLSAANPLDTLFGGTKKFGPQLDGLEGAFKRLGQAIELVTGIDITAFLQTLGKGLDRPIAAVRKFIDVFRDLQAAFESGGYGEVIDRLFGDIGAKALASIGDLISSVPKLIGQLLKQVRTGFKPLDRVISNLGSTLVNLGRLVQEVFTGDFSGALDVAGRLLQNWVRSYQLVFDLLKTIAAAAFRAIVDLLRNVDWGQVWDSLTDAAEITWDALTDAAGEALDAVGEAFDDVDWAGVWDTLTNAAGTAWDAISNGASTALDALGSVDWGSLLSGIGGLAETAIATAGDGLKSVGSWLLTTLLNGWDEIKPTLISYASGLVGFIQEQAPVVGDGLIAIGRWLLETLLNGWDELKPRLISYASGLVDFIVAQAPIVGDGLLTIGRWLLETLLNGWDEVKPRLVSYASGLVAFIIGQAPAVGDGLLAIGRWLLETLLAGWDEVKPRLVSYASGLVDFIVAQAPMVGDGLISIGRWLLTTLLNGWDEIKPRLIKYASGLVSFIVGQVPVAGAALLGVGRDLLNGLLAGWDEIKPTLINYASGLPSWVAGQITGAVTALVSIGGELIQGLIDGITDRAGDVIDAISGLFGGGGASSVWGSADMYTGGVPEDGISSGIVTAISGAIESAIETVQGKVAGWATDIVAAIKGIIPIDFGFVTSAFAGLISALEGVWNTVDGWIRDILGRADDADGAVAHVSSQQLALEIARDPYGVWGSGDMYSGGGTHQAPNQSPHGDSVSPDGSPMGRLAPLVLPPPDTTAVDRAIEGVVSKLSGLSKTQSRARIDGDNSPFIAALSLVTKAAAAWNALKVTAKLAGDNGLFISELQRAIEMAIAWAAATFTSTLAANADTAMQAAAACFDIGRAWASNTFTAAFDIDTTGITNAVAIARQAVSDIAAMMPHSPAKEGPLRRPIRFDYIADQMRSAMEALVGFARTGVASARSALDQRLVLQLVHAEAQRAQLTRQLMAMPASAFGANTGNGTASVVNYYYDQSDHSRSITQQLASDELIRVIRAAFTGEAFANEFDEEADRD